MVQFDDVTVCFTDFEGFAAWSERMPPGEVARQLQEHFSEFDRVIAKYGLTKVKTMGDAYLFVSGLPVVRHSHAVDAVRAALEIVTVSKALGQRPGAMPCRLRAGLHSGPVAAALQAPAIDVWGDTVNIASRMEACGYPDRVNLSSRTYQLVRDEVECEPRGAVRTKDGRHVEMYFANAPKQRMKNVL